MCELGRWRTTLGKDSKLDRLIVGVRLATLYVTRKYDITRNGTPIFM